MIKTLVTGHNGMVGSAIVRNIKKFHPNREVLSVPKKQVDLRNQLEVNSLVSSLTPDEIIVSAAKVGGIYANSNFPAEFIYDNLSISSNIINAAFNYKIKKLLYLGSSCIYPRDAIQPITEDSLLTGPLEETNEWYAISKIAGIKLCQAYRKQYNCNFISAMPTNLYGINDNYHLQNAHVIPALMHRAYLAKINGEKQLNVWGTGKATREFLFVDDLAEACIFLLDNFSDHVPINIGSGKEISILNLTKLICEIVGFNGELVFDNSKPDGTPRKVLDIAKINDLGWFAKTELKSGLSISFDWFKENYKTLRK